MCLWTFPWIAFVPQPSCWAVLCRDGKGWCQPRCRSLCWGSSGAAGVWVRLLTLAGAGRSQRATVFCPLHGCTRCIRGRELLRNMENKWDSPSSGPVSQVLHLPGAPRVMCCHARVPMGLQEGLLATCGGAGEFASPPLPGRGPLQFCSRAWLALRFCQWPWDLSRAGQHRLWCQDRACSQASGTWPREGVLGQAKASSCCSRRWFWASWSPWKGDA